MLRRFSLVECVSSVLHGNRCLQSVNFFFLRQYVQPCLLKNPKYTFHTIKSSLKLAYETGTAMNVRKSEKLSANFIISLRLGFRRNFLSVLHPNLVSSPIKGILEIFNLTPGAFLWIFWLYRGRLF
jgi:hypothetical protein